MLRGADREIPPGEGAGSGRRRQAWASVTWLRYDLRVLFGQTWDVVHPLLPDQLNFVVGWWSGNIGYRRPQLAVSKGFELGGGRHLSVELAVARTLGDPIFTQDVGADSGLPTLQTRVGYTFPGFAGQTTGIGLSGHAGDQECDSIAKDIVTWSAGTDLSVPFSRTLRMEGEAWTGQAVCTYLRYNVLLQPDWCAEQLGEKLSAKACKALEAMDEPDNIPELDRLTRFELLDAVCNWSVFGFLEITLVIDNGVVYVLDVGFIELPDAL